jgi:uncharacterized coiled-coil protein SlyX
MDFIRILEVSIPIGLAIIGLVVRDIVTKTTNGHRLDSLEKEQEEHRKETSALNSTLTETNQRLASLDATMKGLTGWVKRIDERQYKDKG